MAQVGSIKMKAHTLGGPPEELPRLFKLVAFVPFRTRPKRTEGDPSRIPELPVTDGWEWLRRELPGSLLTLDQVPEELIHWKREIGNDPDYGKPHFRLIEVTGEGVPVSPVPGILFGEDEEDCGCPPGVCMNAEEVDGTA